MASRLTGDARGRRLAGSNHIATRRFAWRVRAEHGPRRPYIESTILSANLQNPAHAAACVRDREVDEPTPAS